LNLIENLTSIKKEMEKKKGLKEPGIGVCLVCRSFIDSPSDLICDDPRCEKVIRTEFEFLDYILKELGLGPGRYGELEKRINELRGFEGEICSDFLGVSNMKEAEKEIREIRELLNLGEGLKEVKIVPRLKEMKKETHGTIIDNKKVKRLLELLGVNTFKEACREIKRLKALFRDAEGLAAEIKKNL